MPPLPVVSGADVVRALKKMGFQEVSQKGSHLKLTSALGLVVIVPMHKELRRGTLRSVLRQADITIEALIAHL